MKTYRSLGELPLGGNRRALAIGSFDGVHVGHRAVITTAKNLAVEHGLSCMVVTFQPHPIAVLRPDLKVLALTTLEHKQELCEGLDVDELLILPFTKAFARIRADRFVDMLVSPPITAEIVVVGDNFRFGAGGQGTTDMMRSYGRNRGLRVVTPEMVDTPDGKPVSSTRARRMVAEGRMADVRTMLTRPHAVEGVVVHGDQRGRALGLPTANLEVPDDMAVPGRGVYAGRARVGGRWYPAAVNVGFAPTFRDGNERGTVRIEAFLLDYDGDEIYGDTVRLEFLEHLRDERKFDGPDELVAQIHRDVEDTRRIAAAEG
ncbi:MAG: bifunctional riboflavin kinase/FAD synthetase [Thermoleophilia bacterium]|nr:bifunctional riboflavin kinase/FAD synthetase [Thermoleophilia bacterium]